MLIALSALLIILFIILILILSIVSVTLDSHLYFNDINLLVKVKVWNVTILKYHIPYKRLLSKLKQMSSQMTNEEHLTDDEQNELSPSDRMYQYIDMADDVMNKVEHSNISNILLKVIQLNRLSWYTVVGVGEADLSAIAVGYVWIIKSQLIRWMSRYIPMKDNVKVDVAADYQHFQLGTDISCMMSFRVGKAIIAAFRIVKQLKGGNKYDRASHPGVNENGNGKSTGND